MFSGRITDEAIETNQILEPCPLSACQETEDSAAALIRPSFIAYDHLLSEAPASSHERAAQVYPDWFIQQPTEGSKKLRYGFRFNYKTMRGICNALPCDDSAPALLLHSPARLIWHLFNQKPRVSWSLLSSN
jgi:hypothetical protein